MTNDKSKVKTKKCIINGWGNFDIFDCRIKLTLLAPNTL